MKIVINLFLYFFKMEGNFELTTYNCAGFKPRNFNYLKEILGKTDILLLQETWLYNFEFKEFDKVLGNCSYHAVSAMDECNVERLGRPYGGCAVIWHSNLALAFTPIITSSPRICAVAIKSKISKLVVMSIYMPTDNDSLEECWHGPP